METIGDIENLLTSCFITEDILPHEYKDDKKDGAYFSKHVLFEGKMSHE